MTRTTRLLLLLLLLIAKAHRNTLAFHHSYHVLNCRCRIETSICRGASLRLRTYRYLDTGIPLASRLVLWGAVKPEELLEDDLLAYLKNELVAYLALREEVGADAEAKKEVGKVIGGTKGNVILEYVSASPNKPSVTQAPPNALDYDELTKYGYSHLVTPIMNAGGRLRMYDLLGLVPPPITLAKVVVSVPPIVMDRVGEETRYKGLKLGQALDDEQQGAALLEYQRKIQQGERPALSKVLEEVEAFELPFADKRNVGPKQTPDWTPDRLDEWGRQQGRVESWARQAKLGAFVQDPMESFDSLLVSQRLFGVSTALLTAVAFGKATPNFVALLSSNDVTLLSMLQIPAAALLLASLGSGVYCATVASTKNRSRYVWTVKGFLGGPLTVRQLTALDVLITQQEKADLKRKQLEETNEQSYTANGR